MEFTEEQTNLIDNFINHPLILVFALAGTGKTTSLVSIAMKYSSLKGLYLVFNKANKDEGKVRFPKNFQVSNLHSLAWWALKKYSNINLNSIRNKDYKEIEISRILGISQKESKGVLSVFNKFLNSSLNEIEGDKQIFKNAKRLYEMMKNGEIAITHNFYLKEFEMMLKKGLIELKYDILMLDESQDTNMVTLSICNYIKAKNKIFVGDDNQQIYSFRGSVNAMDKLKSPMIFYLTETFRFPEFNSLYANKVLSCYKGSDILIKSRVNIDCKYDLRDKDEKYCASIENEMNERCYISRTNSILIGKMAELVAFGKKIKTIRHPNEIFSLAEEICFLDNNLRDKIWQHKFLLDFQNIGELEQYANIMDDIELLSAIGINKKIGMGIYELKAKALSYYGDWISGKRDGINDFLTTAHTCKGLEWDYVCIENSFADFISLICKTDYDTIEDFRKNIKKVDSKIVDEFNLFYIALTRCKKSMRILDDNLFYLQIEDWEINKLIFEYRVLLEKVEKGEIDDFEFNPKLILGYEEEFTIGDLDNICLHDDNIYKQDNRNIDDNVSGAKEIKSIFMDMAEKNDEKREHFIKYAQSLTSWQKSYIEKGSLYVNGSKIDDSAIVGVRIGKGVRIHPMEIYIDNNEIVLKNETRWKYSDLTVIDLIENIPEEILSSI